MRQNASGPCATGIFRRTKAVLAAALLVLSGGCRESSGPASGPDSDVQQVASPAPGSSPLLLTEEERIWLREHPVIRVAQDPGWPPVEFSDERGKPAGISEDYLKLIEQRLGTTFVRVRGLSWQESYARLKRWDLDMTTSVAATPEREGFWAFTKPYLQVPIVILTRLDVPYVAGMRELEGKRVAVVSGYVPAERIPHDFPGIALVKVASVLEGLALLRRNEVFAFVDNMLVTGHYLTKMKWADLKIAGETPYVNAQSMAVRKDWPLLAGLIERALDSISEEERSAIYKKWVPIRYEYGFSIRRLWLPLGMLALILAGLATWNRILSREIRMRKKAETALMESERALRQAHERLRYFVDAGVVGVAVGDPKGRILEANDYYLRTIGYSREEFLQGLVDWRALTPPEWLPADERAIAELRERGICTPYEKEYARRDGTRVSVLLSDVMIPGPEEQIVAFVQDITERKRDEARLRDNEEKFKAVFESANVGKSITLPTSEINVNKAFADMLGYELEELNHMKWQALTPDDEIPSVQERLDRLLGGETDAARFPKRYIRKGGGIVWGDVSVRIRRDGGGRPLYFITTVVDITERRRAEEALRASEERYRAILDQAAEAVFIHDKTGRIMDVNRKACQSLGYTRQELLSMSIGDIDPEAIQAGKHELWDAILAGESRAFESRHRRKDGRFIPVELTLGSVRLAHGPVVLGLVRDITERKRAERALKMLSTAVEQSTEGIAIAGLDGCLTFVNDAWCKMHGYGSSEELVGRSLAISHNQEQIEKEVNPFNEKVLELGAYSGEVGHIRKDGNPFPTLMTTTLLKDEKGTPYALVGMAKDITERKRGEEAVQASLREKDILLREIHHRVKNNMQVISSLFNLQAGHIADEDARRMLREGQLRIRSMALIHEKLYQARNLAKIEFASYIQSLVAHLFQFFKVDPKQVRLEADLEDVHLDINTAVPSGLLVNELISNALKHAFPGGRKGTVRIKLRRQKDGSLMLRVADDGIGFPEGLDFQRTESFGLQIVDLLIGQLEGKIELDRTKGTDFTITFRELEYKPRT